jgi:hypothetical protein
MLYDVFTYKGGAEKEKNFRRDNIRQPVRDVYFIGYSSAEREREREREREFFFFL